MPLPFFFLRKESHFMAQTSLTENTSTSSQNPLFRQPKKLFFGRFLVGGSSFYRFNGGKIRATDS